MPIAGMNVKRMLRDTQGQPWKTEPGTVMVAECDDDKGNVELRFDDDLWWFTAVLTPTEALRLCTALTEIVMQIEEES